MPTDVRRPKKHASQPLSEKDAPGEFVKSRCLGSVDDAAEILNVTPRYVRMLDALLRPLRVGRSRVYDLEHVARIAEERAQRV